MINGKNYVFEFDARANTNRIMEPRVAQNGGNYIVYSRTGPIVITPQMQHYQYSFQMTDPTDYNARVVMNCGTSAVTCFFDNISVKESISSDVDDGNSDIPKDFILYTNYPNPFNPATTIKYALPEPSNVKLEVYNIMGQKIGTLIDSNQEAGFHQSEFDGSSLASGIYIYKIKSKSIETHKSFVSVKKMLLLK
jgi:hypothetical protein